jgi:hypothetical protein
VLTDHRIEQERWARQRRERKALARAFGYFIANLAPWDWFVNPLTLRDRGLTPLPADASMARVENWLLDVQRQAGQPIGWMIAEEFGRLGGRWHCHGLVTGVSRMNRRTIWLRAKQDLGYARIERFDVRRGAAFYAAKYAGRLPGCIHFGGTLAGVDLSKCEQSASVGGGRDVAVSVALPKGFFHTCLPRRHR